MTKYDQVVDLVYATALDSGLVISLASAIKSLSDVGAADPKLTRHFVRARQIATQHANAEFVMPSMRLYADDLPPESSGPVPVGDVKDLSRVSNNKQSLQAPNSWRDLATWLFNQLPNTNPVRMTFEFRAPETPPVVAFVQLTYDLSQREVLQFVFPPQIDMHDDAFCRVVEGSLGLSTRQAQVALGIASGRSAVELADILHISANTVRHHTKTIYEKLGVTNQIGVAVVVGQVSLMCAKQIYQNRIELSGDDNAVYNPTNFVMTEDGRRICYATYGAASGTPCLFFHSSFGGRWVTQQCARAFAERNLKLIIMERPGLGLSDAVSQDRERCAVNDALRVMDHLELPQVVGISFSGGAFVMSQAMAAAPERFRCVNYLSPRAFEMTALEQNEVESPLSQLFGLPREATSLIHEVIESIDPDTGWPDIIKLLLAENPVDLAHLDDPVLLDMHVHQARANLACGPNGVAEEWFEYGRDQTPACRTTTIPQRIIVGGEDRMTSIVQGRSDWHQHTASEPFAIEDAGHLVFLTHTSQVLDRLLV